MILIDTGPLISICDRGQANHKHCVETYKALNDELITTLACLTEAMYLLGKFTGWQGQEALWRLIEITPVSVHKISADEMERMKILMKKYQDTPMDFADASLVVTAETLQTNCIFTLDSDFYVYRINDSESFEVMP
jgi:predicted nucleic acid-binding protein